MQDPELLQDLIDTHVQIDRQIRMLKMNAEEMHIPFYEMKNGRGEYLINGLLIAKAQILHALTLLQKS